MKKYLFLACLALGALIPARAQDDVEPVDDGSVTLTVSMDTGNTWLKDGSLANENPYALKWVSTAEGLPVVSIFSRDNQNNMGFVKNLGSYFGSMGLDGNLLAFFSQSKKYGIQVETDGWYVSKVSFNAIASKEGVQMTVNRINYTLSTTATPFEFSHQKGDEISVTFSNGDGAFTAFEDFVITLKQFTKEDVLAAALTKYNFEHYTMLWSAESAAAANQAIVDKCEELIDAGTHTIDEVFAEVIAEADAWYDKLCKEEIAGRYFTFENRDTGRFLAIGQNASGDYESQSITDGNDQHAIWLLTYDDDNNKFRLHNYQTDYDLMNVTARETQIPVSSHENMDETGPGALFSIIPVRVLEAGEYVYCIEFMDAQENGDYHYLHDSKGGGKTYPVKWNDANGSAGSGWFAHLKDINPDGDLAGLMAYDKTDVIIFNQTQGKYLAATGNGSVGYIDNLRPTAVWIYRKHLDGHSDENFALYNEVEDKYVRDLASAMTVERNSNLKVDNVEGKFETWHILTRGTSAGEGDDEFLITAFSDDYKAQMASELQGLYAYEIGKEPSKYTMVQASDEATYTANKQSAAEAAFETQQELQAANELFEAAVSSDNFRIFDINAMEGTALVRIKSAPYAGYLLNWNNGARVGFDNSLSAAEDESTVFVMDGGKLSSLVGGKYLVTSVGGDNALAVPTVWDGADVSANEGLEASFIDATTHKVGAYFMSYGTHGGNMFLLHYNNVQSDRGKYAEGASLNNLAEGFLFNVEFVKTLEVSVDENGFKLWRTPVTINFGSNADNGAYVVSVAGDKISTAAADKETNYGAGTVFLLTKDIVATVINGDATVAPAAGLGHHAVKAHTFSADKVYMELHSDQSAEPVAANLYYDGAEGAARQVRMSVKIVDADETATLDPHAAVIEADKDESTTLQHGDSVMLTLGESYNTTQILEVGADVAPKAAGIYDLQGRRLAAPVKGVNIINGRKVIKK